MSSAITIRPAHLRLSIAPTETRRWSWLQLWQLEVSAPQAAKIMGCDNATAIRQMQNVSRVMKSDRWADSRRVAAEIVGAKMQRVKVSQAVPSDGATAIYLQHNDVTLHKGVGVLVRPLTGEQIKTLPAELTILSDRNMLDRPTDEDRLGDDAGDPEWYRLPKRMVADLAKNGTLAGLNVTISDKKNDEQKAV